MTDLDRMPNPRPEARLASRRAFLKWTTGALALPGLLRAAYRTPPLPIAFSTLGCPGWDWKTILANARRWGFAAIELRGLQGEMDLTKRPEFSATRLASSLADLTALDLRIADLGSSVSFHDPDPATQLARLEEGKRFIDLAQRLRAPYIRVFGDKFVAGQPKQATLERIMAGLRELGTYAQGSGVGVLLESHGDLSDSPTLHELLRRVDLPTVGLLWDTHHTVVFGKETPAETWQRLGNQVRHVHLKDSRLQGQDVRYVLTGAGTVPLRAIVRVLVEGRYRGYYAFEWEKHWHPDIEEPEVAFPHFAQAMAGYLKDAGFEGAP